MRLARLSAVLPVAAGAGIAAALGQARRRGEVRALGALGVSEWRAGLPALIAGVAVGMLGLAALAAPGVDAAALFPTVATTEPWMLDGATLRHPDLGVAISRDGAIDLGSAAATSVVAPSTRLAAILLVAPHVIAVPAWAAAPIPTRERPLPALLGAALSIYAAHAVAADRLGLLVLLLGAAPMAVQAAIAHRRPWRGVDPNR